MSAQQAARQILEWRHNPRKFVYDKFKVEPDFWQADFLDAYASNDKEKMRIALKACAGPGKTAALAWAGWNFLSCYGDKYDHPKGAAVSITRDNLADNLWPEMSKWQQRDEALKSAFKWTSESIYSVDHPETWFISARTFSKTANQEEIGRVLSGLHSKYVLYLIDESGDIPPQLLKSAEQGLSTGPIFGKIIQAGNPTSTAGMLYAAATELAHMWYVVTITGDPEDPKRSPRIDIEWAKQQIKQYGRNDPWVMAYILGLFPPTAFDALIGPDEVDEAMKRHLRTDQYSFAQKRLGVDVARFGGDSTFIFPRQGLAAFRPAEIRGADSIVVGGRVIKAKIDWGAELEFVDGTGGYGAGVIDFMRSNGHSPTEVQFAGKPFDQRYLNKRAENWFLMINWIKSGGALPPIPRLKKELCAPKYTFHGSKFKLEDKDQIKQRLGFSPDMADALSCTFALPDMPASTTNPLLNQQHGNPNYLSEYDPEKHG